MGYIVHRYGTQSEFNALQIKDINTLYFVEDSRRIYRGTQLIASDNVEFTDELPKFQDAVYGRMYVVSDGAMARLFVKGDASMLNIEAKLSTMDSIDDAILDKSTEGLSEGDSAIPTSGLVKKAIADAVAAYDGAFVDVKAERAEDGTGAVITLIDTKGNTKSVTIADFFFQNAQYIEDEHILRVWIKDGDNEPYSIDIDLSGLIADAVVWSDTQAKVNFFAVTQQTYRGIAEKDNNTLYFLTDVGKIFKGRTDVTKSVQIAHHLTDIPMVGAATLNSLYFCEEDLSVRFTADHTTWKIMLPGYLSDGANWAEADGSKLATIGLIRSALNEAIEKIYAMFDGVENNIVVFGADKTVKDSAVNIGGSILSETASANTVATEAAVQDALSWKTIVS